MKYLCLDGEEEPSSVNWDKVTGWKEFLEPEQTIFLTVSDEPSQEVVDAKEEEIGNVIENDCISGWWNRGTSILYLVNRSSQRSTLPLVRAFMDDMDLMAQTVAGGQDLLSRAMVALNCSRMENRADKSRSIIIN